jgi:hypothetical protein
MSPLTGFQAHDVKGEARQIGGLKLFLKKRLHLNLPRIVSASVRDARCFRRPLNFGSSSVGIVHKTY